MAAMDSSNHWYGHAHVLAEYCGLDPEAPPPIQGVIQHGWTFVHGFGSAHKPPIGMTKFSWSDVCRRRGHLIGWRDYVSIGAPFLYLDRLREELPETREGTIWYPFHGTVDFESVTGDHARLIRQIKDVEEGPVTVCLYYVEYEQPEVRRHYEDAGFRVICHGHRGHKWSGGTPDFLNRQLSELRRHRRVASNRLSTAIFYGLATGCESAVYGDPMAFEGGAAGFDGERLFRAWYPFMFGEETDYGQARALADLELGVGQMVGPEELSMILGWNRG